MDSDLQTLLFIQRCENLAHFPNRVVLAPVVVAHNADNADGLLINIIPKRARIEDKCLVAGLDKTWLDVHVLEQFFPSRLEHGRNHKVGVHATDLVSVHAVLLCIPLAPPELQRKPGQQTGLGRAHCPSTGVAAVLLEIIGHGAMPELCDHVQGVIVHPEGFWINRLIRQVDFQAHGGHPLFFWLKHHVHVRAGVQPLRKIQKVVILDHADAVACFGSLLGDGHVQCSLLPRHLAGIVWHTRRRRHGPQVG
mmetsp:Transcript_9186/g.16881  ORF Transcript_9186/g.16881 Transcript_9186/m.16881 type:complete len:251 (-) Transcript_9186:55-807(-)